MRIEFEDLQIGDEIIFPSLRDLRMVRIVNKPKLGKNRWHRSIRCEADVEMGKFNQSIWTSLSNNYKKRVSVDLAGKDIWLVKRNGEYINEQV